METRAPDQEHRIYGASLLGFFKYIKSRPNGDEALHKIIDSLPEDQSGAVKRKIIAVAEYPYSLFTNFLRACDSVMGNGDLTVCEELGRYTVARDIEGLVRMTGQKPTPEKLLQSVDLVWRSYHVNSGNIEIESSAPEGTVIRINGFPQMDPAHCRLMKGVFSQGIKELGCVWEEDVKETCCCSRGDGCHEFRGKWKMA